MLLCAGVLAFIKEEAGDAEITAFGFCDGGVVLRGGGVAALIRSLELVIASDIAPSFCVESVFTSVG